MAEVVTSAFKGNKPDTFWAYPFQWDTGVRFLAERGYVLIASKPSLWLTAKGKPLPLVAVWGGVTDLFINNVQKLKS